MSDELYPRYEMPSLLQHVQNVTTASGPSELAAPAGSEWEKAEIHFQMAKTAMKLAARNPAGAAMAAEHLERAAATLRGITPNNPSPESR